jgi:hypothetical protein
VIGGDLHQVVTERERLGADGRPILIDEAQELLRFTADRPGRDWLYDGGDPKEPHDQEDDGRQTHGGEATIDRIGASATTVDCHYR